MKHYIIILLFPFNYPTVDWFALCQKNKIRCVSHRLLVQRINVFLLMIVKYGYARHK